jgi:DNA mismatch repair ATPase MutS
MPAKLAQNVLWCVRNGSNAVLFISEMSIEGTNKAGLESASVGLHLAVPCRWPPASYGALYLCQQVSLDGFLRVDPQSLHALQIFHEERHPSAMGIGQPKEGLSVFGELSGRCVTAMGRRMMRLWFLRPVRLAFCHVQQRQPRLQTLLGIVAMPFLP